MYSADYLKKCLNEFLNEYGNREAFAVYNGEYVRQIYFLDFATDILKVAGYFRKKAIRREHIALLAKNSYEYLVIYWGILASGNTAVLLNPELSEKELRRQCELTDATYIYCDNLSMAALRNEKEKIFVVLPRNEMYSEPQASLEVVEEWGAGELVSLLFTSGTGGISKAVMLTAENIEACLNGMEDGFQIDRSMMTLPLYHIGGLASILYLLERGKTICIGRGIKYLFQDIFYLKPNHLTMVPGMLDSFVKYLKRLPDDGNRIKDLKSHLKYIGLGGASAKEESCCYLINQGFVLGTGYGMTETTGCGMAGILTLDNLNTLGIPGKGIQCRIENNEILISGKCVMAGYYKDPEATRAVIKNGWLYTGDLGYKDENGCYYLTGRKKNVIILSNGENVSPEEVEYELKRYDGILECMVYGRPKGICADVYTRDEKTAALQIKTYNKSVPTYRQISKVNYYDKPLEKTGSGKIKRKENRYE